ncbi:hypothetical protein SAMN05444141_11150 [Pseudovibrio denitrificans]|uniref:Uncharacterized protein n=1 Tax=Pseudovibrio denitrificans TaxID=258256 RepID=A0A1I7DV64_9HYPH|nr:hypothetical protein SAMN05444141_11150 [Pseudovibrio denitrificans]
MRVGPQAVIRVFPSKVVMVLKFGVADGLSHDPERAEYAVKQLGAGRS